MKTGTGLLLILGVMLSGCATTEATTEANTEELAGAEVESVAPELVVDPLQAGAAATDVRGLADTSQTCFTECYYAFYSDPAKTHLVGECESGPGTWPRGCWGQQTQYRTGGCWRTCEPIFD